MVVSEEERRDARPSTCGLGSQRMRRRAKRMRTRLRIHQSRQQEARGREGREMREGCAMKGVLCVCTRAVSATPSSGSVCGR
jgi:hypothetical protein